MKLTRLFTLLMLGTLAGFTSCESDVEDMDLDVASKVVVLSFISPQDTVLTVQLQRSQPAIGKRFNQEQLKIKDATVTITGGNTVIPLVYNQDSDLYEANARLWQPITAGNIYQLKVVTSRGEVEASCTIPATTGIEITEVNTPYTLTTDYGGTEVRKYNVSFKWTDAPGVNNYYRTLAYRQFKILNPYGSSDVIRRSLNEDGYNRDLQTDEKNKSGVMVSETMAFYEYNDERTVRPAHIFSVLVVADKNYYQYHNTLQKQYENDGNPFAEPAFIYTNVKGGLGVFAGYNQIVAIKELE